MNIDVIKMGGAEGVDLDAVAEDLASIWNSGRRLVLCHGGSGETNQLSDALGHPPQFVTSVSGHQSRRTDRRTLEIFMMATALVNRRLVEALARRGVRAIGLSGIDGGLLRGKRKAAIRVVEHGRKRIIRDDWTGKVDAVDTGLLHSLLERGFLPVIAPLGISEEGDPFNVDGDRAAALVAGALDADNLLILTNVPGVLSDFPDESTLIPHVSGRDLPALMERVEGRMKKKLLGASEALEGGVQRVILADGRKSSALAAAFSGIGTVVGEPLQPPVN